MEKPPYDLAADSRHYLAEAKERAARAWPVAAGADIRSAGVIGAGTMGVGIAMALSRSGITTILVDTNGQALDRARERIEADSANAVARGRMAADDADAALSRLSYARSIGELSDIDLVVEAAFERLAIKQAIKIGRAHV